jgi:hypothetical protein
MAGDVSFDVGEAKDPAEVRYVGVAESKLAPQPGWQKAPQLLPA